LSTPVPRGRLGVLPRRTESLYLTVSFLLSSTAATTGFVFFFYGFQWAKIAYFKIYLLFSILLLLLGLASTIFYDNGLISDWCLVFLRTSLSLAPVISCVSGDFSWWLRSIFVIIGFVTVPIDLTMTDPVAKLPAIGVVIQSLQRSDREPKFKRARAGYSLVGLFLSYFFLSPHAFLKPDPRICGWQAIIIPVIYLVIVLNEAGYFHTATTPRHRTPSVHGRRRN
jgi:hypothetical protein